MAYRQAGGSTVGGVLGFLFVAVVIVAVVGSHNSNGSSGSASTTSGPTIAAEPTFDFPTATPTPADDFGLSPDEYRRQATVFPYSHLERDASDLLRGRIVRLVGTVAQYDAATGKDSMLLLVDTPDVDLGVVSLHFEPSAADTVYAGQHLTVYGTVTGSESYTTKQGGTNTVPSVHARFFDAA